MKTLFIIVVIVFCNFQFPKAYADTSCQPIYGGGQSCISTNNILIDKTIFNPQTNKMVDNLGINDPKYQPDFITTFQIKLTNTSNNPFSVEVKDIFPQYVSFSAGPGTFDENTRTLTFSIKDLQANESRTFTVMGRIVNESSIPLASGNVCVVNQATATTNTNEVAQDNSQFCIEKKSQQVLPAAKGGFPIFPTSPISQSPSTGSESLILFSLVPTGIAGWFLRKKSIKKNI